RDWMFGDLTREFPEKSLPLKYELTEPVIVDLRGEDLRTRSGGDFAVVNNDTAISPMQLDRSMERDNSRRNTVKLGSTAFASHNMPKGLNRRKLFMHGYS